MGEESVDEGGPVLDALEPVLHDRGQPVRCPAGAQVAEAVFHGGPGAFSRFAIVQGSLGKRMCARRLSAGRACSGWSSGPGSCEHAPPREAGRRRRHGRGHLLQMVALTSVPDGELWASFPEATRNDILGLLGMLLERWAVSAGLAAEESGGVHGADA